MKILLTIFLVTFFLSATYAQLGINADNSAPHSSAQLDVKSTTKAFYPPRMTTVQKNAIASPQAGAVVFDNTLNQLSFYNGSSWVAAAGSGLVLPYNQSLSQFTGYDGGLFKVTNTLPGSGGEGVAINATITGSDGFAIRAMATNTNGFNTSAIFATNSSTNNNGNGILGSHSGGGAGVVGGSSSGFGVSGNSTTGIGVNGYGGTHGVKGIGTGSYAYGIFGEANGYIPTAVRGQTSSDYGIGVSGYASGATGASAVSGFAEQGIGVEARSFNGIGLIASSSYNYALITTGGNVGIGVFNPTTILDIKSRIRIRNSTETSGIYLDGTTNTYKGFIGLETDNLTGIYGFNGAGWAVKMNNTTGEWMANGGLSVGGGAKIGKINRVNVALDVSSITTNSISSIAFPVTDAQVGDQVLVTASGNLAPVVIGNCYISTPGFVNVFFVNNSNSNFDPPLLTYLFTLIR